MSTTASPTPSVNLTEGDRKLLVNAWYCFKNMPVVDYTKLQAMGNYKTPASATACYLAARKKMLADNGKMTENDLKLIVMAWQCFKDAPQVDYKKLQEKGGYKTAASATACYLSARKKLLGGTTPSPAKKAVAGTKRKAGKKAAAEYDEEDTKRAKIEPKVEPSIESGEAEVEPNIEEEPGEDGEAGHKLMESATKYLKDQEDE